VKQDGVQEVTMVEIKEALGPWLLGTGKKMDSATMRLYDGAALVRTTARVQPGKRATVESDSPEAGAPLAMRAIERIAADMSPCGAVIGEYVTRRRCS
jgi:hypothetical protein